MNNEAADGEKLPIFIALKIFEIRRNFAIPGCIKKQQRNNQIISCYKNCCRRWKGASLHYKKKFNVLVRCRKFVALKYNWSALVSGITAINSSLMQTLDTANSFPHFHPNRHVHSHPSYTIALKSNWFIGRKRSWRPQLECLVVVLQQKINLFLARGWNEIFFVCVS